MRHVSSSGYSLVELMFVVGLVATLGGIAVPQVLTSIDDMRAIGATRYMSTRLQRARSEALVRSTAVAMEFVPTASGYAFSTFVDGNHNGIRTSDIERGVDRRLSDSERLGDSFKDVDFGTVPDLPGVDGGAPPGSDPIRLGPTAFATFTPIGTATTGSLYIRSRSGSQYVIRIFGDTAKTRILKFNARTRRWSPL